MDVRGRSGDSADPPGGWGHDLRMRSLRWTVPVAAAGLLLTGCASGSSAPAESSTSPAPASSGPLLLGPVGLADVDGTAWAAWSASGVVTPLDADGRPGEPVPVGDTPLRMAVLDGSLWVTTIADGRLTEVDPATGTVGRSIDVGEEPEGVVAFDGHLFVVLQKEAALVEVDPSSGEIVARFDVGGAPRLVAGGVDSLFVTDFGGSRVVRVTPSTGKVTASKVPCPGAQDVAYVDGTVYASCMDDDVVLGLDPDSLAEVARIAVTGDPDGVAPACRAACSSACRRARGSRSSTSARIRRAALRRRVGQPARPVQRRRPPARRRATLVSDAISERRRPRARRYGLTEKARAVLRDGVLDLTPEITPVLSQMGISTAASPTRASASSSAYRLSVATWAWSSGSTYETAGSGRRRFLRPGDLGQLWAKALGWVVINDDREFEIRPTPDRLPGLLFGHRRREARQEPAAPRLPTAGGPARAKSLGCSPWTPCSGHRTRGTQRWIVLADPRAASSVTWNPVAPRIRHSPSGSSPTRPR